MRSGSVNTESTSKSLALTIQIISVLGGVWLLYRIVYGDSDYYSLEVVAFGILVVIGVSSIFLTKRPGDIFVGTVQYVEVDSTQLQHRISGRFEAQMNELRSLGFRLSFFVGETISMYRFFLIYPALMVFYMAISGEVLTIHAGRRVLLGYPVFVSGDGRAFGHPIALGVKFHTLFRDGMLLVSANYGRARRAPQFLRIFCAGASISKTWESHQQRMESLATVMNPVRMDLTFAGFVEASRRDTPIG